MKTLNFIAIGLIILLNILNIDNAFTLENEDITSIKQKAHEGIPYYQGILGANYRRGRGVPVDYDEAFKWLSLSASQNNPIGLYNLAALYQEGLGVPQDIEKANELYAKAYSGMQRLAHGGNMRAQLNLGWMYENELGVERNYALAAHWYRKAADQGYDLAQNNLGILFNKGLGVPKDYKSAAKWYRKAAEQGEASAQFNLGLLYEKEYGVTKDYALAAHWYRKAAEKRHTGAQTNLGLLYEKGLGVTRNYALAAHWYRKAAEQGYDLAQNNLGLLYDKGLGVPKDYESAAKWYRKAAEQGHTWAQFNLGLLYEDGQGVPRDYEIAAHWYRKAAEKGYAPAQNNLGLMYEKGRGVPQDNGKAIELWEKAAKKENEFAQWNLYRAYQNGIGVAPDKNIAKYWCRKAALQGHNEAKKDYKRLQKDSLAETRAGERLLVMTSYMLYQPDQVLQERIADVNEVIEYLSTLSVRAEQFFFFQNLGDSTPQTGAVIIGIRPGGKTRFWLVLAHEKRRELQAELTQELQHESPPEVFGPVAFAINFALWEAKSEKTDMRNEIPPLPEEWQNAIEQGTKRIVIPDDIFKIIWND